MLSVTRVRVARLTPSNIFAMGADEKTTRRKQREGRVGENIKTRINCRVSRRLSEEYDECESVYMHAYYVGRSRDTRWNETET